MIRHLLSASDLDHDDAVLVLTSAGGLVPVAEAADLPVSLLFVVLVSGYLMLTRYGV